MAAEQYHISPCRASVDIQSISCDCYFKLYTHTSLLQSLAHTTHTLLRTSTLGSETPTGHRIVASSLHTLFKTHPHPHTHTLSHNCTPQRQTHTRTHLYVLLMESAHQLPHQVPNLTSHTLQLFSLHMRGIQTVCQLHTTHTPRLYIPTLE